MGWDGFEGNRNELHFKEPRTRYKSLKHSYLLLFYFTQTSHMWTWPQIFWRSPCYKWHMKLIQFCCFIWIMLYLLQRSDLIKTKTEGRRWWQMNNWNKRTYIWLWLYRSLDQHVAVILHIYCGRLHLPLGLFCRTWEWKTWREKMLKSQRVMMDIPWIWHALAFGLEVKIFRKHF